tara:strand:- start:1360 stop:2031 length:672 start_codon:yes stop_codon:yes gene_type:complete
MCGIVAAFNPNGVDMILFRKMMLQAMVRGQHATGISYIEEGKIVTIKKPVKANLFQMPNINTVAIVGHCRYSTSDLEYNQPISGEGYSIAHNGVVSQLPSDDWEEAYGFKATGKNDTELLIRAFEHDLHPMEAFPNASIAAALLVLEVNGPELGFFRNGQRPLWFDYDEETEACWVASTKDIFDRAGDFHHIQRCKAGEHHRVTNKSGYMSYKFIDGFEDLQP